MASAGTVVRMECDAEWMFRVGLPSTADTAARQPIQSPGFELLRVTQAFTNTNQPERHGPKRLLQL